MVHCFWGMLTLSQNNNHISLPSKNKSLPDLNSWTVALIYLVLPIKKKALYKAWRHAQRHRFTLPVRARSPCPQFLVSTCVSSVPWFPVRLFFCIFRVSDCQLLGFVCPLCSLFDDLDWCYCFLPAVSALDSKPPPPRFLLFLAPASTHTFHIDVVSNQEVR